MTRNLRIYYYTVLGAMGGLLAWRAIDLLHLGNFTLIVSDAIIGAVTGLCIGLLIGFAEGILSQSFIRGLRAGLFGGVVGLIAGAFALPLTELAFLGVGGELGGRVLGWALFGGLIGLALGITGGSQLWKSAVGGLLGGAIGGALLELMRRQFADPLVGKVAGLILLGASIGALTALIVVALSRAWLEVRSGKMIGSEFILDKFLRENAHAAIVGSNVMKSDIAITDPEMAPQHARLKGAGTHFTLQDMSVGKGTYVNGRKVEMHRLSDHEVIKMGATEMVYHERR